MQCREHKEQFNCGICRYHNVLLSTKAPNVFFQERCKVDALSVKMHLLVTNLNLQKQTVSVLAHISTLFEPRGKSKSGSSIPTVQSCSSYCNRGGDIRNKWLGDSEITGAKLRSGNGNEEPDIRMCRMGRVWSKEMNAAQGHTLAAISG